MILLLAGHGASAALIMGRNLVLARIIGLEDYGVAMAIAMMLGIVELATSLGLPQQIISRPNGAKPKVQAALHGAQLIRGLTGALVLLAIAKPIASLLNSTELGWMLGLAALSPLCLGALHLDVYRAQRHRRHLPHIVMLVAPPAVALSLLFPLSNWLQSSELMLALIGIQTATTVGLSHILAQRRYHATWPAHELRGLLKFGLPIAGNGVMLCMVLHLEKLIAGHVLGVGALALVALGAGLTLTPALMAARSFQAYHLPRIRRSRGEPAEMSFVLERGYFAGAALGILLVTIAPLILPLVGASFAPVLSLLPYFAALAALRLPKSALATVSLAAGRTGIPLLANAPRLLVAPLLWWVLSQGGDLVFMLKIAFMAEAAGLLVGLYASRQLVDLQRLDLVVFGTVCLLLLANQSATAMIFLGIAILHSYLSHTAQNLRRLA